jgi:hypothetical protein
MERRGEPEPLSRAIVDQGFEIAHFATKDADGGGEAGGENFPPCKP